MIRRLAFVMCLLFVVRSGMLASEGMIDTIKGDRTQDDTCHEGRKGQLGELQQQE